MGRYDAALIPGGGLKNDGSPHDWFRARLDRAIEIQKEVRYIICLSGITPHKKPVLDDMGFPVYESLAAAEYLMEKGIRPERILTEYASRDTIGNAYFARVVHTDPLGLKNLLVITSGFHMQRVREVFGWVFGLRPCKVNYRLGFVEVPDRGMDKTLLEMKRQREKESIDSVRKLIEVIPDMGHFHRWLFTEHKAYACGLKPERAKGRVAESY